MIHDMRIFAFEGKEKSHSCVICLAGRDGSGERLAHHYKEVSELSNTTFIGITPISNRYRVEWYPQPYSSLEQREAVAGQEKARRFIEKVVNHVVKKLNIPRDKIALTGFSAGGVMTLYTATRSSESLAAAVVHSGAALEPTEIPQCKINTEILLTHGRDDFCFDWYERYLPMKNTLLKKGYSLCVLEDPSGTHRVSHIDIILSANFIASRLGYHDFKHSAIDHIGSLKVKTAKYQKIPHNWEEISNKRYKKWMLTK